MHCAPVRQLQLPLDARAAQRQRCPANAAPAAQLVCSDCTIRDKVGRLIRIWADGASTMPRGAAWGGSCYRAALPSTGQLAWCQGKAAHWQF